MSDAIVEIRLAGSADRQGWRSLWSQYCTDQGVDSSEQSAETIWRRIENLDNSTKALIAVEAGGVTLAFINYIIHSHTWSDRMLCFVVDLYVDHSWRRQGIAEAMIAHLAAEGRRQGWARLYWNTDKSNVRARALYDKIARLSPYLSYFLEL
ncbi:GNAT family N-acetyltransferase [Sinorhizobium mexicanum]|uniref:GNAT family N-acetyltransferase n=1 Tax=Sinorhizobium mexicanum TaxID=375549 RepID=A0A859QIB7_9HYPH|nr:GNAT family N-acetyltransferase [Sinorhizobium mexicanum]MBP1888337.1 GNAT superfamily N-acetyltransferase [Sinorhizobium mexicanum]QLL64414.1 GNAT family N-acetyltransferase [Sinorhizobium mexicanum]